MAADGPGLRVLISQEQLSWRLGELAERVLADYEASSEILLVGVLKGSLYFLADFSRLLGDKVRVDFAQVSSYGDEQSSSGVVRIKKDLDVSIEGKDVLIVEDVVDTGLTISHLRELFGTRRPKSLRVCTLLSKPMARKHHTQLEYVGFEIGNEFVVGYGLDYAERYRNLPFIALLQSDPE